MRARQSRQSRQGGIASKSRMLSIMLISFFLSFHIISNKSRIGRSSTLGVIWNLSCDFFHRKRATRRKRCVYSVSPFAPSAYV